MIEVKFYKLGTIVYSIFNNKITSMEVIDVHVDAKEVSVRYTLRKGIQIFKLSSELLFISLESLKEEIDKQFDALKLDNIEKVTKHNKETKT